RGPPHEDTAPDALQGGSVGNRLGGVACRPGTDARSLLRRTQRRELVQHPPWLERAGALEELGLEVHLRADQLRERSRAEARRAVEVAGDRLAGAGDVVAGRRKLHRPSLFGPCLRDSPWNRSVTLLPQQGLSPTPGQSLSGVETVDAPVGSG